MHIDIMITRELNGRTIVTQASLSENGWQQWGGTTPELGQTSGLVEALQTAAQEQGAFDEEEARFAWLFDKTSGTGIIADIETDQTTDRFTGQEAQDINDIYNSDKDSFDNYVEESNFEFN